MEELVSYLERSKKLSGDDPDTHVNMEYLKTCVYKFMISTDTKDKIRLSNVISTILKLTAQEKEEIMHLLERELNQFKGVDEGLTHLASFASSFFSSSTVASHTHNAGTTA